MVPCSSSFTTLLLALALVSGFQGSAFVLERSSTRSVSLVRHTIPTTHKHRLRHYPDDFSFTVKASSLTASDGENAVSTGGTLALTKSEKQALARQQGGRFARHTKFGALNFYAITWGLRAILLGFPWYIALKLYEGFQRLTRKRFDKLSLGGNFINQAWGVATLAFTRSIPEIENKETLDEFLKQGRAAMFVANHNSWYDIPFTGYTLGWRNYKIIAKQELYKVPVLGGAIRIAGHILVDRKDKRSGLRALKTGMQYLRNGVHLVTYPEGTRTRTGKLQEFKAGAFKMAHKVGAPVVPLVIVGAHKTYPYNWMFPFRTTGGITKVIVQEPIESNGKTEQELQDAVRQSMIAGMPEDQWPDEEQETNED